MRYGETNYHGVITINGEYSHVWNPQISSAVVSVAEAALRNVQKRIGGQLPTDLQGLLGCWSWVSPGASQLCLLLQHARDPEGYYIAHEVAHLLHHSQRSDLFISDDDDIRKTNLAEMIAHAGGLSFTSFSELRMAVRRLEALYSEKKLEKEPLLKPHRFTPEEQYRSDRAHLGGYAAAEFILSKNISIRTFVEMDVAQAEQELARLGYQVGLYIEPKRKKQQDAVAIDIYP
ncbi:MAG TPA: hypothetical protein VJA18_02615 [Candidatus Nanoarchaeia archaeon]|nr:hypothetical protein [Candidatus Nanoarchaeia archaeon]